MKEALELFLISSAPLLVVVAFLLLALMALRLRARGKAARMRRAEHGQTGLGATTWDAMHGAPTAEPDAGSPPAL